MQSFFHELQDVVQEKLAGAVWIWVAVAQDLKSDERVTTCSLEVQCTPVKQPERRRSRLKNIGKKSNVGEKGPNTSIRNANLVAEKWPSGVLPRGQTREHCWK